MEREPGSIAAAAVGAVALAGALAVGCSSRPGKPKRVRPSDGEQAMNESFASTAVRAYLSAQSVFRREDHYGIGKRVYANATSGAGFPDLCEIGGPGSGGKAIGYVDAGFARATPGGTPRRGYVFADITGDADGPYDPATECGICAAPAEYDRTGLNVYIAIMGESICTIYQKDAALINPGIQKGDPVPPVTTCPRDLATWVVDGQIVPAGYVGE